MYAKASGKYINKVQIFNVTEPVYVRNSYIEDMPNQNPLNITFTYNNEERSLTLKDFLIPVDSALKFLKPVELLKVFWWKQIINLLW